MQKGLLFIAHDKTTLTHLYMYFESLDRVVEIRPALEIEPTKLGIPAQRTKKDFTVRLKARATELSAELAPPKRKVQIAKSVEYPPDFKPIVKLIKPRFMGVWKYPEHNDTCAICRESLAALCINCESLLNNAHKCTVQWGSCKHAYHSHCITKWVQQRNACPICQQEWLMVEEESPLD